MSVLPPKTTSSTAKINNDLQIENHLSRLNPESHTRSSVTSADSGARTQFASDEVCRELAESGFFSYAAFVRSDCGIVVRRSSLTTNRRVPICVAGLQTHAYLKVYNYHARPWHDCFRRAKPLIEAKNYELLHRTGIAVPDVLAFGCRRRLGRLVDGFIMTREIPGSVTLEAYFDEYGRNRSADICDWNCARILTDLAGIVARMHAANFFHIDLQWRNILVSRSNEIIEGLYILDCVRGGHRIHPLLRRHGMLRDLASLYKDARRFLSATQQLRWLRQYFGVARLTETHHAIVRSILRDREIKSPERSG